LIDDRSGDLYRRADLCMDCWRRLGTCGPPGLGHAAGDRLDSYRTCEVIVKSVFASIWNCLALTSALGGFAWMNAQSAICRNAALDLLAQAPTLRSEESQWRLCRPSPGVVALAACSLPGHLHTFSSPRIACAARCQAILRAGMYRHPGFNPC